MNDTMEQKRQTISGILRSMQVGDIKNFPYSNRKSIRATLFDLKTNEGRYFETKRDGDDLLVELKQIKPN